MLVKFVLFWLLLAGKIVCDDFEELEDDEDEDTFAEHYLTRYHYISPTRSGNHDKTTAIKNFQKFFGLPQTGELDEETLEQMRKPRCGLPDVDDGGRRKRFSTNSKWSKTSLTYYMEYGDDMTHDHQLGIIIDAFAIWRGAAPSLTFTYTDDYNNADFRISFGRRTHSGVTGEQQCDDPFDGQNGDLAHAYVPTDGRIHFDDDEPYSETGSTWWLTWTSQSLIDVATHQIGHALGLGHSDVDSAVMWPSAKLGRPTLAQDDINGIESLYGKPLYINIRSEGCDDPGKTPPCGVASIKVDETEYSLKLRGHNVVIVDKATGAVLERKRFDTYADDSSGTDLRNYLNSVNGNKIVLVAVQDEGSRHMSEAIDALKRVGATEPVQLEYRESFALAGYADLNKPSWISQETASSGNGPSRLSLKIPLSSGEELDVNIRSEGCDDPGRAPPCGVSSIKVDGTEYSLQQRGHNVVIVDGDTGAVLESKAFDTYADGLSGNDLRLYLDSFNGNEIVLVAIQDDGSHHISQAIDALKRVGATEPVQMDYRGSFALAGYAKLNKPSWVAQKSANRGNGPSYLSLKMILS